MRRLVIVAFVIFAVCGCLSVAFLANMELAPAVVCGILSLASAAVVILHQEEALEGR